MLLHCSISCHKLVEVWVATDFQIEMLAKGLKYVLYDEEKEKRVSLTEGQFSTPPEKKDAKL